MIAWINLAVLSISTVLTLVFYVKSAGPAALEKRIGPAAYDKCARYRLIASAFMTIASINYVLYFFFPLPLPLPASFPWPWWVSVLIAVAIAIPSGYVWYLGLRDAGRETMFPEQDHTLYGGIYEKIRHPQALGELPFWWVLAFGLHSPFLVLYSLVWIPVFLLMVLAEEEDLLIRYGRIYEEYRQRTGFMIPRRKR
jgi:protein-S-isoprenylcysteine O-methyltransferase Ste14